jgi:hypothetical protein
MSPKRTLAQRTSIALAVSYTLFGIIGLIVNPDFGTGAALTSKFFLIDWNGWHAVSALLLGATAFVCAARPLWAFVFLPAFAFSNAVECVWALIDSTPLGLLYFPNVWTDIVLHAVFVVVSLIGFVAQVRTDRLERSGSTAT